MKIIKTTTWKNKKFLNLFIKQMLSKSPLDPWPVIKNSPLFVLYNPHENKEVSYCTIKSWNNLFELGNVLTEKKLRGKGYSSELINKVLEDYKKIYVTCETNLESFYKKFDFEKIKYSPYPIKQRVGFVNFFSFLGTKKYICMERSI
ncbi:MAG: hypothetical protein QT10_C0003G0013 [archaeon GW2011_AR19]|nr:MAG: hypothetical protein QT10_C0003G0013 [archaeon GW2011_AR19]